MSDGEGQGGSERVERADEVHVAGKDDQNGGDPGEDDEREHGCLERRVEAAEDLGNLPVARHRVGHTGGADHTGVRGDEQDRGGEHAHVDLEHAQERARDAQVFDHAENRIVGEPALLGGQCEQRRQLPVDLLHRQCRQRDERQGQVDRKDGPRDELVGIRHAASRLTCLLRKVGDGLHPRIGEHCDRHGDREVRPGRRDAPVDVVDEDRRTEHEEEPEEHEEHLRREIDHREDDRELRGLLDTDDVETHENRDHDRAADDVPRIRLQGLPEDREVMRHEERRRGDRNDVHEHLGPRSPEADDLVERMPSKARRPTRLRVENRALRVGGRRHREHQPRDEEDQRRQSEGVDRRESEGVVDRRADVAVSSGEERRRSKDSLELDLASAATGHRRSLRRSGHSRL